MGCSVVLSPSGTHMKHDGRMRGGIFHCQSEGGMVIHSFLYYSFPHLVAFPFLFHRIILSSSFLCHFEHFTRCRNNDNSIILLAWARKGRKLPKQPIYRLSPRTPQKEKVQKTDKTFERALFSQSSLHSYTHFYTHNHTRTTSPSKSFLLWPSLCCLLLLAVRRGTTR